MALTVGTNSGALMAQAAASSVNRSMETSMERLSTGKRINSAADDAAGVAIASRLSSEIKGTNMAIRNAMDGQALIDTAEGAHSEVENILQRMRELSVQAETIQTQRLIVHICKMKCSSLLVKSTVLLRPQLGLVKTCWMEHLQTSNSKSVQALPTITLYLRL